MLQQVCVFITYGLHCSVNSSLVHLSLCQKKEVVCLEKGERGEIS